MQKLDDEQDYLLSLYVGIEELFNEEEDVVYPYTRSEISVKDGGFTEDDCEEQRYFNSGPRTIKAYKFKATPEQVKERENRNNKLVGFVEDLSKISKAIAFIDDYGDIGFWEFDRQEEFQSIVNRSVNSEYTDTLTLWDEDEALSEFEQIIINGDDQYVSICFPELKCLLIGDSDQIFHLFCWDELAKKEVENICKSHMLYIYEPEL